MVLSSGTSKEAKKSSSHLILSLILAGLRTIYPATVLSLSTCRVLLQNAHLSCYYLLDVSFTFCSLSLN